MDFVNAVAKDDALTIKVIGHDNQVLEIEAPARHVLEQIVAKTGLPSWLLGFHWSTAERLAERQGEILLQESRTRFAFRRPGLSNVIATMLRARGRTWKKGDWEVYQELPSLQDLVAQAQAGFLQAQTELMRSGAGIDPSAPAPDLRAGTSRAHVTAGGKILLPTDAEWSEQLRVPALLRHSCVHAHQKAPRRATHKVETYVEDETALMRLERRAERGLMSAWDDAYDKLIGALGLDVAKSANATKAEPVFIFDPALLYRELRDLQEEFVRAAGSANSELARSTYDAWLRGLRNASSEIGVEDVDALIAAVAARTQTALATRSLELVSAAATRALREDIAAALADGVYDGQNPSDVARALRVRFDAHDVDWERLARSEIADANAAGKLDTYAENGIEEYEWIAAGGACPICEGHADGGPYRVGAGPHPMSDSHPNCRCTVVAVPREAD